MSHDDLPENFTLKWTCQGCGREVTEVYENEEAAEPRCAELWKLEKARELVCDCGKAVLRCERCGACCAYHFVIYTAPKGRVAEGHLSDFDGVEGALKRRKKPWSGSYRVCLFLKKGVGCFLHGGDDQPIDCTRFNCRFPQMKERRESSEFFEFRKKWRADGMGALVREEVK